MNNYQNTNDLAKQIAYETMFLKEKNRIKKYQWLFAMFAGFFLLVSGINGFSILFLLFAVVYWIATHLYFKKKERKV